MNRSFYRAIAVTALVSSVATVLLLRSGVIPKDWRSGKFPNFESPVAAAPSGQPTPSAEEAINIRVYEKVGPGVVNITSTVVEYEFFFGPVPKPGSTGSGCVIDLEGTVVTNYHVIADAQSLEAALPDHSIYRAKLVGADRQNDIAVIRMIGAPKERLRPIPLGDSASLKVGQRVLAIGNPLRLQNTLTTGIISSLGRRIRTESGDLVENVIQTDAAINPGNSGGPLLNAAGEIVGINTAIFTLSGGSMGIGFAIPANTVRRVVNDLLRDGRVIRPWLGVEGYEITKDLASTLDLPVTRGILVARVYRGSSADNAGIRGASQIALVYNERFLVGGDIIADIDGRPIPSVDDLRLALEGKKPGETIQVTIYRGRTKMQKSVLLMEAPRQRGFRF